MNLIVCIDDAGGMMFNRRRVSRDSAVIADIVKNSGGRVFCSPYSAPLFEGLEAEALSGESFLADAEKNESCFVEDRGIADYIDKAEKLTVYKWNRRYPSDLRLDIPLFDARLELVGISEFAGSSHERITKEEYLIKR